MMIKTLQELIPEYTDTSETDTGIVILEAVARCLDTLSYYQNAQATECFLSTAEIRENILKWSKMLDYTPRSCTPAKYVQYFVVDKDAGSVVIPMGQQLRTDEANLNNAVFFTTLSQLNIDTTKISTSADTKELEKYGYVGKREVDGKTQYIFKVDIAHGTLIKDEVLTGNANPNEPNQRYTLSNSPVALPNFDADGYALLPRKLSAYAEPTYPSEFDEATRFELKVTTGTETEEWVMKSSFIDSKATDKHYTIEVSQDNTVSVVFGDGVSGAIPSGTISVSYRKGGGSTGNVGAETITVMPTQIRGVVETYNPDMAYSLGVDKETNQLLRINIPNSYRTKWACVEDVDYADKLKELFNRVFLCSSLSLTKNTEFFKHPECFNMSSLATDYPESAGSDLTVDQKNYILDTVQICVLLTGDILNSDGKYKKIKDIRRIEDAVEEGSRMLDSLGERAMLGTHQILTSFTSKTVILKSTLLVRKGYEDKYDDIKKQVSDYITEYFSIGSIKAGQTVSLNELEADVYANISGIRAFRINSYLYKYVFAKSATETVEWYGDGNSEGKEFDDLDITSNPWEIIELDDQSTFDNIKSPIDRR